MLTNSNEESSFQNNIKEAINAIKSNKYDLARKYLHTAMIENDHSAEVYNLLGVISEYKGEVSLACEYYRAAYVFDPTYKPADKNLEKLTSFFYIFNEASIDYGDNMEKENKKLYFIEYNAMNVGHLKKSEAGIRSAC
jgi:tetratricopeptide (TPR) repeat protein